MEYYNITVFASALTFTKEKIKLFKEHNDVKNILLVIFLHMNTFQFGRNR